MNPAAVKKALQHLKKDARMRAVIGKHVPDFKKGGDPFQALCRSIIYQQLSGKAAGTIHRRFLELYSQGGLTSLKHPTPQQIIKTPLPRLRAAGLSTQKAAYLKDLSKNFLDGTIEPKKFAKMTDEEIREHLIAVKGIGRWTADMFLMFTLHRPDVLPTGDLAIQKAIQKVFKLKKMPSPEQMVTLSKVWSPHRTVACWYLWNHLDTQN